MESTLTEDSRSSGRPKWRSQTAGLGPDQPRSWRSSRRAESGSRRPIPWLKRSFVLFGVVLAAAAIYGLLWWIPQQPRATLLVLAKDYSDPKCYPALANPFANKEFEQLELLGKSRGTGAMKFAASRISRPADIRAPNGTGPLVLYVDAIAARCAGEKERPIRVLSGEISGPDDFARSFSENSLAMTDIWSALRQPSLQKVPKLVLLDLGRLVTDWRMGLLENSLYDEEQLQKDAKDIPNLSVLCSGHAGQASWSSTQLGGSVFAHFVRRGLAKEAELKLQGDRNQRELVVSKFFAFVTNQTGDWVYQNRGSASPQEPFNWLSSGSLRAADSRSPIEPIQQHEESANTYDGLWSERLEKLWGQRDRLRADPVVIRLVPLRWRQIHYQLMQAESLAYAGDSVRANDLCDKAAAAIAEIEQIAAPGAGGALANAIQRSSTQEMVKQRFSDGLDHPEAVLDAALNALATHSLAAPAEAERSSALALRQQAETAAAGPLGTAAAVRDLVLQTDKDRYSNEDFLFVHAADNLVPHKDSSIIAKRYENAIEIAQNLAAARQVLDTLASNLPEMAYWAARGASDPKWRRDLIQSVATVRDWHADGAPIEAALDQLPEKPSPSQRDGIEADLLRLFSKSRRLRQVYDAEMASKASDDQRIKSSRSLRQSADDASKLRQGLQNRLEQLAKRAEEEGDWTTSHRQEIVDALQNSLLPVESRRSLVKRLLDCDQELLRKPQGTKKGVLGGGSWNALWILQVFSLAPFPLAERNLDGSRVAAPEFAALVEEWRKLVAEQSDSVSTVNDWVLLGDRIRRRWLAMRDEVERLAEKQSNSTEEARRQGLRDADLLARILHGYDAAELAMYRYRLDEASREVPASPSAQLAHLEMSDTYQLQARRHLAGFWSRNEAEADAPWFVQAARSFLQLAKAEREKAGLSIGDEESEADAVRLEGVSKTLSVSLKGTKSQRLWRRESQGSLTAEVALRADRAEPLVHAQPAMWLALPRDSSVQIVPNAKSSELLKPLRPAAESLATTQTFQFRRSPEATNAKCSKLALAAQVFLRGRWAISKETAEIDACRPEPRVVKYAPLSQKDRTPMLTVSGSDRRSVLFILDCSSSMDEKLPTSDGKEARKFDTAKEALRTILANLLAQDPKGQDRIGLITYGNWFRLKWKNDDPKQGLERAKVTEWAELTRSTNHFPFEDQQEPSTGDLDYQSLIKIDTLANNRSDFAWLFGWSADFSRETGRCQLQPSGETPLGGALKRAMKSVDANAGTPNAIDAIVVLTDGVPNDTNWRSNLKEVLQDANRKGITVAIIEIFDEGFLRKRMATESKSDRDYDEKDLALWKEFEEICNSNGSPPIRANDPSAKIMAAAAKGNHDLTLKTVGSGESKSAPLPFVKKALSLNDYFVYFGRFDSADSGFRMPLQGGERINLQLHWDTVPGQLLRAEPAIAGSTVMTQGERGEQDPDWMRVQSFRVDGRRRRATFRLFLGHNRYHYFVRRPPQIEFEIQPEVANPTEAAAFHPSRIEWNEIAGELPGWEINVSDWPGVRAAVIKANWRMKTAAPDRKWTWKELQSARDFEVPMAGREGVLLKVEALESTGSEREGKFQISVVPPGGREPTPEMVRDLASLYISFGKNYPYTRELSDDGTLIITFGAESPEDRDRANVSLTFGSNWWAGSIEARLTAAKTDEER